MSMRRSKFTLGPKPATSPTSSPKKHLPKSDLPKVQKPPVVLAPEEEEEDLDDDAGPGDRYGLPKQQLELEYAAVLQERDMLLHQLAGLLEELMAAVPES
jgi:hypothetical protein